MAAVVEDVLVGFEDPVGEPVVSDELPDVLDRIQFGRSRRQEQQGDVVRQLKVLGAMPSGLVEDDDGMRVRRHGSGDLGQMQGHGVGIAAWQDQAGAFTFSGTDGTKDIGRTGALILWRGGPGAALGPAAGDLVLLADPGLIL